MRTRGDLVENFMVLPGLREARGGRPGQTEVVSRRKAEQAAYQATEKRLYERKVVRGRAEDAREELAELERLGAEALQKHDASMVRLIRPGMRLSPEEVHETQVKLLRARLAADERELKKMSAALECLKDDPFYRVLDLRYERGMTDGHIAEKLRCDRSTVVRHRIQLVKLLASRLYGV